MTKERKLAPPKPKKADAPKRITKWHNVYDSGICSFGYSSRKMADKYSEDDRVCVYCITCNPDYSNPVLFMEDV